MPTISNSNLPTPKSWDEFESIVLSTSKIRWRSTNFFGNGRRGQRQDGVDVFGTTSEMSLIGIQCKNTLNQVTQATVTAEVRNAESFNPPLGALYIATTAQRDANLQKVVREMSAGRVSEGKFEVHILFWEDISSDLATDEKEFFKHYPQFFPKSDLPKEHDKELYSALIELLASNGVIEFLDKTNVAGFSFLDSELDPLREFYYTWHTAEHELINPALESMRKALWEKSGLYLGIIATETWSTGGSCERRSVPEEWEFEQPERFSRVVGQLHDLADEIVGLYKAFIREARDYFVGKI